MKYNELGTSGIKVSEVSFGCMSLTPGNSDNEILLKSAWDNGINFFDTADLYNHGANEELIGATFKNIRDKVIISTKGGNEWQKGKEGWNWNPSPKYLQKAIDGSLSRLQTDYIDLYMLHGGTIDDPIDDIIDTFERAKSLGKIRAYGISSIRPNVIKSFLAKGNLATIMTQYSLLDRRPEEETFNLLKQQNVGVMARGTVASGLLVNKPAKSYLNYSIEEIASFLEKFKHENLAYSLANVAQQYVLQNEAITTAVIGMRNNQQLKEALYNESNNVPIAFLEQISSILPSKNYYTEHR